MGDTHGEDKVCCSKGDDPIWQSHGICSVQVMRALQAAKPLVSKAFLFRRTHMAHTRYVAPKVMIKYGRVMVSVLYRSCVPRNWQNALSARHSREVALPVC